MAKLTVYYLILIGCAGLMGCDHAPKAPPSALFAGLSADNDIGQQVVPGYQIQFPRDHGSHPEFAIEWWYLTANLKSESGQPYPIQWTLFRFKSPQSSSPWSNDQMYMAHGKISSLTEHWFEERFARGGVGNSGIDSTPFRAYLDNWQWQSESDHLLPARLTMTLANGVAADLTLTTDAPYVLHGKDGYSKKAREGTQASYYYSQPFIQARGQISLPQGNIQVQGPAWFDHEWSSQYLASGTVGWDWFSLHLDDGSKLMLFNLRLTNKDDFWSGSWISQDGAKRHLDEEDISATILSVDRVKGREIPLSWSISVLDAELTIQPIKKQQWNQGRFSYYEGAITVSGTHKGQGFMELTGY